MQELGKIFGSEERVKIIRFFLASKDEYFTIEDINLKTKVKIENIKKEILVLEKSNLIIKSRETFEILEEGDGANAFKNKNKKYKDLICYVVNDKFRFLEKLEALMFDFENANRSVLLDKFKTLGRVKYMMLSGVFLSEEKSRVDIMCVIETPKKNAIDKLILELESEIGKKLNILILDLDEFNYRYKMFDRVVRDALRDKKEILLDKLNLNSY